MNNRSFFSDCRVRIVLLSAIVMAGFAILAAKLFFEQVRRSDAYQERISRQTLRRIRIPAHRGKIFSADMVPLADNDIGISVVFYPEEMRHPGRNSRRHTIDYIQQAAAAVFSALNRPQTISRKQIARHLNLLPGLPITVADNLTLPEAARILELARFYNGIGIESGNYRCYPRRATACHVIGFAAPGSALAALDRKEYFYYVPDLTGRSGLEKVFDRQLPWRGAGEIRALQGIAGFELVQVDSLGFIRNSKVDYAPPVDGNHLILTLNSHAQHLAEEAIAGKQGAFVMMDAATGAILAMASSPGYDLEKCTPVLTGTMYRRLLHDPGKPLLNRAASGCYTPGSILKVLVAMALLENGVDPEEKVDCPGYAEIGSSRIRCAATAGHGPVNLREAIERSCNVYFIRKGMSVGLPAIRNVLISAGLGQKNGLLIPESAGTIPPDITLPEQKKNWTVFDTALITIGQGRITLTPLQAAAYCSAIANGGKFMRPYLVDRAVNNRGVTLYRTRPQQLRTLAVSPENLEIVRQGMRQVVQSPYGSGRNAATPLAEISGKTGSAEVGTREHRRKNVWFIGFCTIRGRTFAAAMVQENGRAGGRDCAPAVGEFFEKWSQYCR